MNKTKHKNTKRIPADFQVWSQLKGVLTNGQTVNIDQSKVPDILPLLAEGRIQYIPFRCPKCHQAGMLLLYDMDAEIVYVLCGPREDAFARCFDGCNLTIKSFSLAQNSWYKLLANKQTLLFFFAETIMGAAKLFNGFPFPIYKPKEAEK